MARKPFSFSIWLVPDGHVYDRLQAIIDMLSTEYKSPPIRPHVTLAGGFTGDIEETVHKAEGLAKKLKPFDVELTSVDCRDEFFRSLYILAAKTPDLMQAHETARKQFGMPQTPDLILHMSLIYGDFSDDLKEKIISEIGKDFNLSFRASEIHLVVNNEHQLRWPEVAMFPLE